MRVLCIGRNGQLARALSERAKASGLTVFAYGRPDLDLTKPDTLQSQIDTVRPDILINAAAYTAVDAAESDHAKVKALNVDAVETLARSAKDLSLPLIHFSTDYVFDGTKAQPYSEDDPVGPRSLYGQTKLAGEQALSQHLDAFLIFRTAWVYSPFGKNFVKTMLRLAETRDEVSVVDDQVGNPTSALDLADATLKICRQILTGETPDPWGLYHLTGSGTASWASFAQEIFSESAKQHGPTASVRPIPTTDYPTPAKRPQNSQLATAKLTSQFGITLPEWQKSLAGTVKRLLTEGERSR